MRQTDILQIQSVWMYSSYAASRIACDNSIPYVVSPAGTLQSWALGNGCLKGLKKAAYFRLIAKSLMAKAACVQAASIQEAEQVRRLGHRGLVTVIPNGVDIDGFADGDASHAETCWPELKDRRVVLFMSRLSPEKGLDLLIPVWAELMRSRTYSDAVLVIAGPDDRGYQRTVEKMIDEHGMRSRICMVGMVRGREKAALLRRADVFILPSYSENFGIVVAEAMACGTPVITTTGTPWEQLQQVDAGRWMAPTNEAVGQALRELLDMSESKREQMGARGAALIREQYTWDRVARKFLTVCDCIVQGRSIPLHPEPKEIEGAIV
jgi:glycosyltransferase involved in cell wall biosynthesis